jgi:predicted negative regulator of RcsB-dependent stress response
MPKPEEVEEAEVNAYMDAEAEKPADEIRKLYLKQRYETIKAEYRSLRLAKEEAEQRKDEKRITELTQHFRDNFKARKWAVTSIRQMGDALADPFIPLSAE